MFKFVQAKFEKVNVDRDLIEDAVDCAISNGILMKLHNGNREVIGVNHVPFALFPSPVNKDFIKFLTSLQADVNKLMQLVVEEKQFMLHSLQGVNDDFTQRLIDIFKCATANGRQMAPEFAVVRTDYMFDYDSTSKMASPKHIETNTMAASFIGIGTEKMRRLYQTIVSKSHLHELTEQLPENKAAEVVAKAMLNAFQLYKNPDADIVFLVRKGENNVYDQRQLEYELNCLDANIKIRRVEFCALPGRTQLKEDGTLLIDNREVGLLYFRDGYQPEQYTTEEVWNVRRDMELSRAIKSPSVGQQLFGCKKMQEVFARPGMLEKFLDEESANKMRQTFCGLHSLDMDDEGDRVVQMAIKDPHRFVLKPQREGGGNNIYGNDIAELLKEIGSDSRRSGYILMDLIRPNPTSNYLISNRLATKTDVVSELGIYGTYISSNGKMIENRIAGHLYRSKPKDQADGGVASGVAVLDSILLI